MRDFEKEIIEELISKSELRGMEIPNNSGEELEFNGVGYFLTLKHKAFPTEIYRMNNPGITASLDGIVCWFTVVVLKNRLELECFSHRLEFSKKNRDGPFERLES